MGKIACSWSGGKDSCFALMQMIEQGAALQVLVNMMNENGMISRSHGIPKPILHQQARAMNISLIAIPTSWNDYEMNFIRTLQNIKSQFNVSTMVFGDIDLQAHRDWEEKVCLKAGLRAALPLWQKDRKQLVYEMLNAGIETMIVSCNTVLGEDFLGKMITESLIPELETRGVDVCGENGEFHTLVVNCPLFTHKIGLPDYQKIKHEEYWFLQWDA
jgi:diphthine-ammonia ligase